MRIMVIGSSGQLGRALAEALEGEDVFSLSHAQIEITDPSSVRQAYEQYRPEAVINTAAFHRVDECEIEVEKAFRVNAFAVRSLALACREFHASLVHFSTDYVFGGQKREPYTESDLPQPLSVYGAAKLAGEHLVAAILPHHFLIRTCGLFGVGGSKSKGGNFVETMLGRGAEGKPLRVVNDQVVAPTYAADLARKVAELIHTREYGLYHISSKGSCTWYDFALRIFEISKMRVDLSPTTTEAIGARARRPPYSVMRHRHLEQIGGDDLPMWDDALRRYLAQRKPV